MRRHLLVTNDFPPKHGGIQSYLWELWRRLPSDDVTVLTTPYVDDDGFDADQPYRTVRSKDRVLLPTPPIKRRIEELAEETKSELVVLDPALPIGLVGPSLSLPYAVVLHGAEVTVPGRLPASKQLLAHVIRHAERLVAAGGYPRDEAVHAVGGEHHLPPTTIIPPGVDVERFRPAADDDERAQTRRRFGLDPERPLVLGLSRLVPRKGFDVLIDATKRIDGVQLAIAGGGRDKARLEKRANHHERITFLGRVDDDDLPALYAAADVFAMLCRGDRWAGLEKEGFGIVFLEAAAAGVPALAGDSGGAAEAVVDGETGLLVHDPRSVDETEAKLRRLIEDGDTRRAMGRRARQRAESEFTYDLLARRLEDALS